MKKRTELSKALLNCIVSHAVILVIFEKFCVYSNTLKILYIFFYNKMNMIKLSYIYAHMPALLRIQFSAL